MGRKALEAYSDIATRYIGNPSSTHPLGIQAKERLEEERRSIAAMLGTKAEYIFFTSGGTEADSIILSSLLNSPSPGEIITTGIEHAAVLEWKKCLESHGWRFTALRCPGGYLDPGDLKNALNEKVRMVAVMKVNNVAGTILDTEKIVKVVRAYRLYSREDYDSRPLWTTEEILRTDLSEVVLRMVDLGIYDFETFPYITKPDSRALQSGERTLRLLDAIDEMRHLTSVGEIMVRYPLLPRHSRAITEALKRYPSIIKPVAICLAFLSARTPFVLPPGEEDLARSAHRRFSSPYGDFVSYQSIYRKYLDLPNQKKREQFCKDNYLDMQSMDEIVHITAQLCDITAEMGIPVVECDIRDPEQFAHDLLVCLGSGLVQYVCIKKRASVYRTLLTDEIYIHPGSAWFRNPPPYLLAGEIVMTTKMYARTVSPLYPDWVPEISKGLAEKLRKMAKEAEIRDRRGREGSMQGGRATSRGANINAKASREAESKVARIFNFEFPVIKDIGKKRTRNIVVIPSKDIPALAKAYRKSSRHPKGVVAAILYNGSYLAYGESLYDVISIGSRIDLSPDGYVSKPCTKVFDLDDIRDIIPYLPDLMKVAPLKEKGKLGYVEILISGKSSVFFHTSRSFNDAVNNSAYSILSILDNVNIPELRKAYNRILRLLD